MIQGSSVRKFSRDTGASNVSRFQARRLYKIDGNKSTPFWPLKVLRFWILPSAIPHFPPIPEPPPGHSDLAHPARIAQSLSTENLHCPGASMLRLSGSRF